MATVLALLVSGTFCLSSGVGPRVTDARAIPGISVSKGAPQRGKLLHAAELPVDGAGYIVGYNWRPRHTNFGTWELVRALENAAATVAQVYPHSETEIADISRADGGDNGGHASHESGRDADVVYYSTTLDGDPLPPPADMLPYAPDGSSVDKDDQGRTRRFDDARNWEFIRTMLTDPSIQVEYVFMQKDLRARVLAYAAASGEPESLRTQAAEVLRQPTDSLPHDDHMHIRIGCPASDVALGCIDEGVSRHHHRRRRHHHEARAAQRRHRRQA